MKNKCCDNKKTGKEIEQTVKFLKTISEENRIRILCLLKSGPKCVCKIWPALDLSQNLISHHLSVLKASGLVKANKQGLNVFYELNEDTLKQNLNKLNLFLTSKL